MIKNKQKAIEYIIDTYFGKNSSENTGKIHKIKKEVDPKIIEELYDEYPWTRRSNGLLELVYCLRNNIKKEPKCLVCGKPLEFYFAHKKYNDFCSRKCAAEYKKNILKYIDTKNRASDEEFDQFVKEVSTIEKMKNDQLRAELKDDKIKYIANLPLNILGYIKKRWPWVTSTREAFHCYLNNIDTKPVCVYCRKPVEFKGSKQAYGYSDYCSLDCAENDSREIIKNESRLKEFIEKKYFTNNMTKANRDLCNESKMEAAGFGLIKDFVLKEITWAKTLTEAMYAYYYDIKKRPVCERCGGEVRFVDVKQGYKHFCSLWCAKNASPKEKKEIHTVDELIKFFKNEYFKNGYSPKDRWRGDKSVHKIIKNNKILDMLYAEYPWTKESGRLLELAYCITHAIHEAPRCPVCGKRAKFNFHVKQYNTFCSHTCRGIYSTVKLSGEENKDKKLLRSIIRFFNKNKNKKLKNLTRKWLADRFKTNVLAIQRWCEKFNIELVDDIPYRSTMELEMKYFLDELKISYIENDREVLNGQELDFYLPDFKLGIEIHGTYWHSLNRIADNRFNGDLKLAKNYHVNKFKKCNDKGIKLYQIYEHQWKDSIKREIWKSRIAVAVNHKNVVRIYARKCQVKEVSNEKAKEFLNRTHIDGNVNAKINLGLYNGERLVALMTFGKTRFDKKNENKSWELYRYSSELYTVVIGGASKLLKYFINNYMNKNEILISFSNNDYSNGQLYEKLGFEKINYSESYFYVGRNNKVYNRLQLQKHKLPELFEIDKEELESKTADQIIEEQGISKIYTSGQTKWKLEIP